MPVYEVMRREASHRSARNGKCIFEEGFGRRVTNPKGSDYMPIVPRYKLNTSHKSYKIWKVYSSLAFCFKLPGILVFSIRT